MLGRHSIRFFSTSNKAHLGFLSQLRQSRRAPLRWLQISVLLFTSVTMVNSYAKKIREQRKTKVVTAERDFAETQHRNNALLDAYGDRSSLEELERARQLYEKRNV
ncbi:hypothetical protein E4U41_000558 [Claviceps citrina]|nr:hypothetical protein E4U41_000558 [Claviceps citrina]